MRNSKFDNILPKISIVTPVFNQASFLEDTILSVLSQGYNNIEYIIIDGGSTDGTKEIIEKYNDRISYWVSEQDNGMYHAIQKGFEKATGEIMAWINSDDLYKPGSFNMVASVFNDCDVEWIIGIPSMYNKEGNCVKVRKLEHWSESRFWIGDYKWIQQENVFWKRSLWEKTGGLVNTELRYAGDFDLWCRFFKYSKLYSVETTFAGFRLHGSQLSVDFRVEYEREAREIKKRLTPQKSIDFARFFILLMLKNLRTFLRITYILIFIDPLIKCIIKKLHCFPGIIYYDFNEMVWKR